MLDTVAVLLSGGAAIGPHRTISSGDVRSILLLCRRDRRWESYCLCARRSAALKAFPRFRSSQLAR
jgi:hypothetical protein